MLFLTPSATSLNLTVTDVDFPTYITDEFFVFLENMEGESVSHVDDVMKGLDNATEE